MATFSSNLIKKVHRHRGIYSGKPYEVAGRILIPAGTELKTNDILLAVPAGENQIVKEVTVTAVGSDGTLKGTVGYFQMLDKAGQPVKVQRRGPSAYAPAGDTFTSPTSDPDAFAADAVLEGYARTQATDANVVKLAGPVNIGVQVTTGETLADDLELFIGVQFDGETSTVETGGDPFMDNSYLL